MDRLTIASIFILVDSHTSSNNAMYSRQFDQRVISVIKMSIYIGVNKVAQIPHMSRKTIGNGMGNTWVRFPMRAVVAAIDVAKIPPEMDMHSFLLS